MTTTDTIPEATVTNPDPEAGEARKMMARRAVTDAARDVLARMHDVIEEAHARALAVTASEALAIVEADPTDADSLADALGDADHVPLLVAAHPGCTLRKDGCVVPEGASWQSSDGQDWQDLDADVGASLADALADAVSECKTGWGADQPGWWDVSVRLHVVLTTGYAGELHDSETVQVKYPKPECAEGHEHDWCSPYEVLGGLKENPGVQGKGGGVVIREVCRHCGAYRVTDTWAQNPATGEQGLHEVRYCDADDESRAWVASKRLASAKWVYTLGATFRDEYAVACSLVDADGEEIAGCLVTVDGDGNDKIEDMEGYHDYDESDVEWPAPEEAYAAVWGPDWTRPDPTDEDI